MVENLFEKLDRLKPEELEKTEILQSARSQKMVNGFKTYVCPRCGNGSHSDNSLGMTVKEFGWGYNYWCHRCGNWTGTKILREKMGSWKEMERWYKTEILFFNVKTEKLEGVKKLETLAKFEEEHLNQKSAAAAPSKTTPRDYTELYQKAQAQLAEKLGSGGGWRGLELADLQEVGAGRAEGIRRRGKRPSLDFSFQRTSFFYAK